MGIYDYSVEAASGEQLPLSAYEGKVIMIVNTATACGFTPHYEQLEDMYRAYHDQGLEIIDIPCNQFGAQAPGTDEEIRAFCTLHYNTEFPQMKKADVNGENELPLYTYLKSQKGFVGVPEPTGQFAAFKDAIMAAWGSPDADFSDSSIRWNFTKFIVNREGEVVARFEPTADMADVEACVKSLL